MSEIYNFFENNSFGPLGAEYCISNGTRFAKIHPYNNYCINSGNKIIMLIGKKIENVENAAIVFDRNGSSLKFVNFSMSDVETILKNGPTFRKVFSREVKSYKIEDRINFLLQYGIFKI